MLAYTYKQPPLFNDLLSNDTFSIMRWGVILNMFVSFWMFSNQQMFTNQVHSKDLSNQNSVTNHTIFNSFKVTHAIPLFVVGIICFILFSMLWAKDTILKKYLPFLLDQKVEISEGFPKYSKALNRQDRDWVISEENHMRKKFNIPMLSDEFYQRISSAEHEELNDGNTIHNVFNYDILANPLYQEAF